jgi:hypothetical protein
LLDTNLRLVEQQYLQEPRPEVQWPIGIWRAVPPGGVRDKVSWGTGEKKTTATGAGRTSGSRRASSESSKFPSRIATTDAKDVTGTLHRESLESPQQRPEPQPLKPTELTRNASDNINRDSHFPDADILEAVANKRASLTEDFEAGRVDNAEGVLLNAFGRTVANPAAEIGDAVSAVAPKFHEATKAQRMTLLRNSQGSDYIPSDVKRELGSVIRRQQGKQTAGAFETGQVGNATGAPITRVNATSEISPGKRNSITEDFAAGSVSNTKGSNWKPPNVYAEIGQVVGGKRISVQRDFASGKSQNASGVEEGKYGYVRHNAMNEVGSEVRQRVGGVASVIESGQMIPAMSRLSHDQVQSKLKHEVFSEAERQQAKVDRDEQAAAHEENERMKISFAEKKRLMSQKRKDDQTEDLRSRVQQMKDLAKQNEATSRRQHEEDNRRQTSIQNLNLGMSYGQVALVSDEEADARLAALEAESLRMQGELVKLQGSSYFTSTADAGAQQRIFSKGAYEARAATQHSAVL